MDNSTDHLVDYLASKGIRTWPAAGAEITAHCFFLCPSDKHKGKLYLNTESWLWDCKRCGTQGGRRRLLEHFGDTDTAVWLPGANPATRMQLLADYTAMAAKLLEANDDKLLYLIRRGLTADTIMDAQLGYVPENFSICGSLDGYSRKDFDNAGVLKGGQEFHAGRIVIPYQHRDKVVQIRGKALDGNGRYWTPAGESVRLYRADTLRGAEVAIITEGEFDALILAQALRRNPHSPNHNTAVVGLPGAGAWPGGKHGFADYFRDTKRVYIGLDADDTGIRESEKLKEALGSKARIVMLPTDARVKVDWTEYLRPVDGHHPAGGHTADDVDQLLSDANATGRRMFSMTEAHQRWRKDKQERPGLRLGWASLDMVLQPGLRPGNVCVPMAKTGCIAGDAEVIINRAGKGFRITMADLAHRFNGGKPASGRAWNQQIETRIQREDQDGTVRLATIRAAWSSGRKVTYEVTTETGRTVRATDEHPFLTDRGWLRLDQLVAGSDRVHVNKGRSTTGQTRKPNYYIRCGLIGHPHAGRRNVRPGGTSVPLHRLVAEAQLNGIPVEHFIARCRTHDTAGLKFIDPQVYAVHHIDHDPTNNDPGNLKVLTHSEHAALHAEEGTARNVLEQIGSELVTAVRLHGEEETYDVEVEDDPHNYIANGFVVHNTGKTVFLANLDYNLRNHRVLHITLENTVSEMFELLWRIYHFWHPAAEDFQITRDMPWLRIVDANRLSMDDMAMLVQEYTADIGEPPELVNIDYLGYLARGMRGVSAYDKNSEAVMQLKAMAKAHNVAVISPCQSGRAGQVGQAFNGDEARDSGVIEETSDFMFGLYRPGDASDPNGMARGGAVDSEIACQIIKSRRGGKGRVARLHTSPASLVMVDALDAHAVARVQQETAAFNRGLTYEEIARSNRAHANERAQLSLVSA